MIIQHTPEGIKQLVQKSFLRYLYYGLQAALDRIRNFCGLIRLYGFFKTFHLYRLDFASRIWHSLINNRIIYLASQIGIGQYIDGSSTRPGMLYHEYALPETQLKAHRKNTVSRLSLLKKHLPIYKARVLDIGCGPGGISLSLAVLGAARAIGIDHDKAAIQLATAIAEKYEIENAEFQAGSLSDFSIPEVDIIIWLSQWMWMVKQHGLEHGKDMLFEIPRQSGARVMVFESAADDGKAAIPGTTQDDIYNFLRLCTPFTMIKNIGPFKDRWRQKGKERMVFVCSEPKLTWQGKEAIITRIDRHTILKEHEPQRLWAKELEAQCLRRLEPFPYFPKLLDIGDNWIKMEWAGNCVTKASELEQLNEIVKTLSSVGIVHRDICQENLLYRDGQLFLIDFGWAIVDGREPPATPARGLGRGFYEYGVWDDARAAKKVLDWFEKKTRGRRRR